MGRSQDERQTSGRAEGGNEPSGGAHDEMRDGVSMAPDLMLELARKAAELAVGRIDGLPDEDAWDGEFRPILGEQRVVDGAYIQS